MYLSVANGGLNAFLLGLVNDLSWKFGTFANSMQNQLFRTKTSKGPVAIDLLSFNINRGRDHGIPTYASIYKYCNNGKTLTSWADLTSLMNSVRINQLASLYE